MKAKLVISVGFVTLSGLGIYFSTASDSVSLEQPSLKSAKQTELFEHLPSKNLSTEHQIEQFVPQLSDSTIKLPAIPKSSRVQVGGDEVQPASDLKGPVLVHDLLSLDDETLVNLNDVLENTLAPAFQNNLGPANTLDEQMALEIFVSRLPESMQSDAFSQLNDLLRDALPYDIADKLTQQIQEEYIRAAQEQILLSNLSQPESMEQQLIIATNLEKLHSPQKDLIDVEDSSSQALTEWQSVEKKLKDVTAANQDKLHTRNVLIEAYDEEVADDYIELSEIEAQWQEKFAVYQQEKQIITNSGLSEADKHAQIEALIKQHYDEKEWAAVRGYDDMINNFPESEG